MNDQFVVTTARGTDVDRLVRDLRAGVSDTTFSLGFIYATDGLAYQLDAIMAKIRQQLTVNDWVGTVGLGVCCNEEEFYDEPVVVMMLTRLKDYTLFKLSDSNQGQVLSALSLETKQPNFAVIHGNPGNANFPNSFDDLCSKLSDTFFVGGLSSSNNIAPQILTDVVDASISGVLFTDYSKLVVSHTQGCVPLENKHIITKCEKNLVLELDHRPAVDVIKEDIGEVLAQSLENKNLEQIAGYIFAGFPIQQSDTNDYLVRNIIGFNFERSIIAVGEFVEEGCPMIFCRRDGNSAVQDMQRMLVEVKSRIGDKPKGALYFSCLARGRNQFGGDSVELKMIREQLGEIPLVGFFANGEILHNRLYGYTGVLTVFT